MSKGSKQRPGTGYADGWSRIFGKREEPTGLDWHYGPTETDPDPGKRWHYGCGGEILGFEEGDICNRCEQSEVVEEAIEPPAKTCQHCKHWRRDYAHQRERCNNIEVIDMIDADDWRCIEQPADWGCMSWEAKV